MLLLSTGSVAELLNVQTHRFAYLTQDRKVRPSKGPTGAFLWSLDDVARAAELLRVEFDLDRLRGPSATDSAEGDGR